MNQSANTMSHTGPSRRAFPNENDPVAGITESMAFMKGVAAGIAAPRR